MFRFTVLLGGTYYNDGTTSVFTDKYNISKRNSETYNKASIGNIIEKKKLVFMLRFSLPFILWKLLSVEPVMLQARGIWLPAIYF